MTKVFLIYGFLIGVLELAGIVCFTYIKGLDIFLSGYELLSRLSLLGLAI